MYSYCVHPPQAPSLPKTSLGSPSLPSLPEMPPPQASEPAMGRILLLAYLIHTEGCSFCPWAGTDPGREGVPPGPGLSLGEEEGSRVVTWATLSRAGGLLNPDPFLWLPSLSGCSSAALPQGALDPEPSVAYLIDLEPQV